MLKSIQGDSMQKSDLVREHVRRMYIEPARRQGQSVVKVVAGDVQKAVHLSGRTPLVCQALGSNKILQENHMILEKREGPPSGLSTTVTFTYRLQPHKGEAPAKSQPYPTFVTLRGIGKEIFASLGGGEQFIRKERESFYGDERDR
jgi:hypothetical protein